MAYRLILDDGRDLGEGPWSSAADAVHFANAEVGVRVRLVTKQLVVASYSPRTGWAPIRGGPSLGDLPRPVLEAIADSALFRVYGTQRAP